MMTNTNRTAESRNVKKMIKDQFGVDAKVGHGTGTAYSWMYVTLKGNVSWQKEREIMKAVEEHTHRDVSIETPEREYVSGILTSGA
jgi:hypothetical protein